MIYWLAYGLLRLLDLFFFRAEVIGRENIPPQRSYIIASNHISYLDPFLLGLCSVRHFYFLAKESLFKTKISNFFFRSIGAFPVKRDTSDFGAMREALRRIKSGNPLVLFPEGTRGYSSRAKKPHPGIGFLAAKAGVPVVPVYISGSDKVLPEGAKRLYRHPIKIMIGQPVTFPSHMSYEDMADHIVQKIYSLSKR